MAPLSDLFKHSADRPAWAKPGLAAEGRAALHEAWVELFNRILECEDWEARVQPALDRLK